MMYHDHQHSRQFSRMSPNSGHDHTLFKLTVLVGLTCLVWSDNIVINFGNLLKKPAVTAEYAGAWTDTPAAVKKKKKPIIGVVIHASNYNNLTFAIDPSYAQRHHIPPADVEQCHKQVQRYIHRFSKVAVAEMEKYGIPASITLAQGLLESNAGMSKLCRSTNNHFGIKCFSKSCRKGHCQNFSDDTHKDFFRKYANAWQSFRAHSEFLKNSARYRHLFELKTTDFAGWARGLAAAGYATDSKYGEKLIAIIHNLDLQRFDKLKPHQIP